MILPKDRDPRLITIRRGGSLTDEHHKLLTAWALTCAEHVLPLFEQHRPHDTRPRDAITAGRAWIRGEMRMMDSRALAGHANAAARDMPAPVKFAAYAAGQAAAVPHVAAHDLGAAAYAIRAAAAASPDNAEHARLTERDWQRAQLPGEIRDLVLDDQRIRNSLCWHAFDD